MHGIEEGLLDKGCAEASDLLYVHPISATSDVKKLSANFFFH